MLLSRALLLVGSAAAIAAPSVFAAKAVEPVFVLHQSIALTQEFDGIDGSLIVLRDARLTESDLHVMQEHDSDKSLSHSSRFASAPMLMARLILKAPPDGRMLQWLPLEKPQAELEAVKIGVAKRVILVTQDFGIGMGSYNGPITKILSISSNSMSWASSRARNGGQRAEISLMRSLKSAWNFTSTPQGKDILAVDCRPDTGLRGFTTTYTRLHLSKDGWIELFRTERGEWEAEDGDQALGKSLPDEKKFPHLAHVQ